jgi:hypothetical protein
MNILIRIYLRRILELVSCGICKWLCNSAFRFCSSTNGYATLHFDFVHRQMAMQLYISVLFIDKMAMQLYISILFIDKMVMQLYISILFIDKMVMQLCIDKIRFCSSTKWLCNFAIHFDFVHRQNGYATLQCALQILRCYRYQLQLLFFSQSRISTIFALGRSLMTDEK